jgi:hypothetical protein
MKKTRRKNLESVPFFSVKIAAYLTSSPDLGKQNKKTTTKNQPCVVIYNYFTFIRAQGIRTYTVVETRFPKPEKTGKLTGTASRL